MQTDLEQEEIYNPFIGIYNDNEDKNTYIILPDSSQPRQMYLAIITLFIGIMYIFVVYLVSFIDTPIENLSYDGGLINLFFWNPKAAMSIFNDYINSKMFAYNEEIKEANYCDEKLTDEEIASLCAFIQTQSKTNEQNISLRSAITSLFQ